MAVDMKAFNAMKWYYQVLAVAAVCAGIYGGVWYGFFSPMSEDIAAKDGQLVELRQKIDKALRQKAVLEQFKKESAALEAKLEELKRVLPQDKETDQILLQVQSSARAAGLRIQRVVSRPVIDHEVYTEWPLDMDVAGTYHNIGMFLDKIRQLPRIVNIGSLRIQSRPTDDDAAATASVAATYTATTFVYREEAAPAPAAKGGQGK